jgi:hypothetical protein
MGNRRRRSSVVIAAMIGAASLGISPAAAAPVTVNVSRDCPFGITMSATLSTEVETPIYLYAPPMQNRVTGSLTIPTDFMLANGVTSMEGTVKVQAYASGVGEGFRQDVTSTFRRLPVTPGSMRIPVVGYTPPTTYMAPGRVAVGVGGIDLRLDAYRADGSPFILDFPANCLSRLPAPDPWHGYEVLNVIAEVLPPPTRLQQTAVSSDGISLSYDSTSGPFWTVVGYEVLVDEQPATQAPGLTATVTGLVPDTDYWIRVRGVDSRGGRGALSTAVKVRTAPAYDFDLAGSSTTKTVGATLPLTGSVHSKLAISPGGHSSTVTLDPSTARARLLPLAADVAFTPVGPATGTLKDGVLTATSKVTIALPRVTLFGYPVSQSPTCATTVPAEIALTSAPGFTFSAGGTLGGTYTIPPFAGCGAATTLLNAFVAGPGNTVEIKLTQQGKAISAAGSVSPMAPQSAK